MEGSNHNKSESEESAPSTSHADNKETAGDIQEKTDSKKEVKFFQCEFCALRERYDYFGHEPPFTKCYKLLEEAYVIEDPFVPPKQNEYIILGSHCIKCGKSVCKDNNCSLYYDGTYCIHCAKDYMQSFPQNVQEKLNRIIS